MSDIEDESEYLTPSQAAELLNVHRSRMYALHREGRYGRVIDGFVVFTRDEVERYRAEKDKRPKGGRPSFHTRPKEETSPATR